MKSFILSIHFLQMEEHSIDRLNEIHFNFFLNFKASFTLCVCVCVCVCVCIKLQHCVYAMLRQMQIMGIEPILCVCVKLQTKLKWSVKCEWTLRVGISQYQVVTGQKHNFQRVVPIALFKETRFSSVENVSRRTHVDSSFSNFSNYCWSVT